MGAAGIPRKWTGSWGGFLCFSREILGQYLDYAMTTAFHVLCIHHSSVVVIIITVYSHSINPDSVTKTMDIIIVMLLYPSIMLYCSYWYQHCKITPKRKKKPSEYCHSNLNYD
jgi:hypothetical protein